MHQSQRVAGAGHAASALNAVARPALWVDAKAGIFALPRRGYFYFALTTVTGYTYGARLHLQGSADRAIF